MHHRAIVTIARKDLLDALVNLRLVAVIVLPVLFSLLYRVIFTSSGGVGIVKLVVLDPDGSRLAEQLDQPLYYRLIRVGSLSELRAAVVEEGALGGIAIPPGFDAALARGERPPVQVLLNAQRDASRNLPRYVEEVVRTLAGQALPARLETQALHLRQEPPQPRFDLGQYLLVLWLMMSLTMTGITIPPGLLVEEKEKRTIRALLVTPASYADVIAAKALVGLVYVMLGAWFILWLNQGFTGEVALTSVVILLTALFMVEIGLCLGALFNDLSTLQTWSFAVLLPFMLPGMLVPLSAAGVFSLGPVDLVLRLLPTYYTVTAIQPALNGTATLARLADDLAIIGLGIVVAFGLAVALLRRREC